MPFKSKAQVRKCFAEKKRNPKSSWDCKAWARETPNLKRPPARVKGRKR